VGIIPRGRQLHIVDSSYRSIAAVAIYFGEAFGLYKQSEAFERARVDLATKKSGTGIEERIN